MFNFIFDGKIGEILAPVKNPNQQLYLAIQHHRSDEIQDIILRGEVDLFKLSDSGYGAIHVACRYNNRFALDFIINAGVPIESPDNQGNSPLHYASKYGNIELCKILISRGCSPAKVNNEGRTPYDVTENHVVRQYLLPLQLQGERQQSEQSSTSFTPGMNYMPPPSMAVGMPSYTPPTAPSYSYAPPPPPPQYPTTNYSPPPPPLYHPPVEDINLQSPPPPTYNSNIPRQLSNPLVSPSTVAVSVGVASTSVTTTPSAPSVHVPRTTSPSDSNNSYRPPSSSPLAAMYTPPPATTNNTFQPVRLIQPDGFHSSASDPALQKKYGHNKMTINIAPPPTGLITSNLPPPLPSQYSMYSSGGSGSSSSMIMPPSRYVAYDVNATTSNTNDKIMTSSLPPPPPPHLLPPTTSGGGVVGVVPSLALAVAAPPPPLPMPHHFMNNNSSGSGNSGKESPRTSGKESPRLGSISSPVMPPPPTYAAIPQQTPPPTMLGRERKHSSGDNYDDKALIDVNIISANSNSSSIL